MFRTALPADVAEVLRDLRELPPRGGIAWARYLPDTDTVEFFGGIDEGSGRAIFSSMAGALSGHGMQILSAGTHTLADGLLLLHYVAHDPDYPGEPPPERLRRRLPIARRFDRQRASRRSFAKSGATSITKPTPPSRICRTKSASKATCPTNARSSRSSRSTAAACSIDWPERCTICSLLIRYAKIGTYLDQVVDVFYVTERDGSKPQSDDRLAEIRNRLLEVISVVE